jgi:phosphoribosylaminoimidazole-succinocarboxamide synthase
MQPSENPSFNTFELNWEEFIYDCKTPISEGKTKKVLKVFNDNWSENNEYYIIEEKNIATAWDWKRTEKVEWDDWMWKWDFSATINANYFTYLNKKWINTAFIKKVNSNHTLVKKLDMIPVECVYRFVETGSYTKRQNHILWDNANPDWTVLDNIIVELFYKDDVIDEKWEIISDPLISLDNNWKPEIDENWFLILLYPKTGEVINYKKEWKNIDVVKMKNQMNFIYKKYNTLIEKTEEVWKEVKNFWEIVWLNTYDWKIEFWVDKDWNILLWDSVDADSNRIRKVFTVLWKNWKTYLYKNYSDEELEKSWKDKSFFQKLEVIPENVEVKEFKLVIELDKDWFRNWEDPDKYLRKVKTLAEYSSQALDKFMNEVDNYINEMIKNAKYIINF